MSDAAPPALSANALTVLARRYLARGADGSLESPEQLYQRVALAVAAADRAHGADPAACERTAARFAELMRDGEFLPNSPTLMNAGRPLGQLAACFVVPVPDSTEAIFEAVRLAAIIQKTGGGTGFSFSRLRPAGDRVASTGGTASGPVSFMNVFDVATWAVKQGGTRRGANMGMLRVDHPDILEFVACKLHGDRMRNFNLSVAITDRFMAALEADGDHELINPRSGEVVRALRARRVFDAIAAAAWAGGDPGLVFIDRVNATQPTPALGAIEATNPCGEQPLLPFESCTLGSINLARFVTAGAIAWSRLGAVVRDAVHFLDNVLDVNHYPLPEIAAATRATRKIGLGVMGFADLLIDLGVAYDEPAALAVGEELAAFIARESLAASRELGARRGSFPALARSRWAAADPGETEPLRNATTTTVAPTGTISILAGCSSGIEPLYAVVYQRRVLDGAVLHEVHPGFRARMAARGLWSPELEARLAQRGRVRGLAEIPADLARLFPTAHDVSPVRHVEMQAVFQRHVHAAVSKTVNLPAGATVADVEEIYRLAYRLGCKGVTIYRDQSRAGQVLSFGAGSDVVAEPPCPECVAALVEGGGCRVCASCGYSVCG